MWVLIVAPLAISEDAVYAEAKKSNDAKQLISQSQKLSQNSQLGSAGGISFFSESNFNLQTQFNSGNNALAQSND